MASNKEPKKPNVFKDENENNTLSLDEKSSVGVEPNIAGLLSYAFGFISGIIIFLIEKESRFVKFHAMQSMILSVALFIFFSIVNLIPIIGLIISLLFVPIGIILWVFMMYKAYKGEWFKLPVIGDFSMQQAEKM